MSAQISPAFAPLIGGFIEEYYSWKMNFLVLAIITAISLFIIIFIFEEKKFNKKIFNFCSIITDYKLLISHKEFIVYSILSALVFSYTIGYYTINPFVFQDEYSFSPSVNGIIYILYSSGLLTGSYVTKKIANRLNLKMILNFSIIGLILTSIMMVFFNYFFHSFWVILIFSSIIAICCGSSAPILIALSMLPFQKKSGVASALQGMIKMIGTATTLSFLLIFHVVTSVGLSMVFLIVSLFIILVLFLDKNTYPFKREKCV